MFSRTILSLIVLAGLALPISAGDAEKKAAKKKEQLQTIFKKLDTNNDDKLSKEEFAKLDEVTKALKADKAKNADKKKKKADKKEPADKKKKKADKKKAKGKADEAFVKLDANKDSFLSKDEFAKLDTVKNKKNGI